MTGISGFFTDHYKSVAEKLNQEAFENFKNAGSDFDRIKILYPYCKDMTIGDRGFGKNYDEALQKKNEGNSHFVKHEVYKALQCYNTGIVKCPSKPEEHCKLLTVLIANRSACLFEMGEHEKALHDITYALSFDTYPEELKYKLFLRQAKCYSNVEDRKYLALDAYTMAMRYLNQSKLNPKVLGEKQSEITETLKKLNTYKSPPESSDTILDHSLGPFTPNASYRNASDAITFVQEETLGYFAVAAKDIETSTIIIDEPAYCAVVAEDFALTNCQHCMLATDTPVACSHCAIIVFCSLKCKLKAFTYHRLECGIHPILFSSGASINCCMALRIITQRNIDFFEKISEEKSNDKRFILDCLCGIDHDYYGVYRLCRNEEKRTNEEYVQYTIMAIYLLKLLKMSSFFNVKYDDDLTNRETFIGSLILRHLQSLQFNAHEISELREAPPGPLDPKDEPNFKAMYIGGGLYTTLALFNHSCDPSIVRYNIGKGMIVKTIKPIKKGDIIYENYGPIYTNSPREERRKFLSERYWFTCNCQACEEDWPEFKNMVETEVKVPCANTKCNNFFHLHDNLDLPAIKCDKCHKIPNLFLHLKALSDLENILPRAEEFYKKKQYDTAAKLYLEAIKIYSRNTVPPFPDWVKVQQRLRTCIVSEDIISAGFLECSNDVDCIAPTAKCTINMCECPLGQVFNSEGTRCLSIAIGMEAECEDDNQCGWLLGKHRCNEGKCDCEEGWRYYEGRCIKAAGLNEACNVDQDCFNNYDILAMVCKEGVCVCNEGYYLRGNYDCRPETTEFSDYCSLNSDCKMEDSACIGSFCTQITKNASSIQNSYQVEDFPVFKAVSGGYELDCESNNDCTSLQNSICYALTKKCICKRGYFLTDDGCIAELGINIDCTKDRDCKVAPGWCNTKDGKCYCRKTYFYAKSNAACQKPMTQDNLFCNNDERCHVFGTEVTCLTNNCRCKITAELDEDFVCRTVKDPGTGGCNNDNDCTSIINSICSEKAQCECPENYRLDDNTCLPNIGAACDDNTKPCIMESTTCGTDSTCTCIENYVPNGITSCLKMSAGLDDECEIDLQCSEAVKESKCTKNTCQCIDNHISINGSCYMQKFIGDVCTRSADCYVVLGSNVQCRNSICQCSADMQPTRDRLDCESSASSIFLQINAIILVILCYLSLKFSM